MAKISKKDLEHLTNDEIKSFYLTESYRDLKISPIKEYIEAGVDEYSLANRINRVERLLDIIIVQRFVKGIIK